MLAEARQFVNWVRRTNPGSHTWKDYTSDLKVFAASVGDCPLKEITFREVDDFVAEQCEKSFKPKTVNRRLTTITALYEYFSPEDESLVCPVYYGRHHRREPKRMPRPMPIEILDRFFAVVDDIHDRAMFSLMLRGGLRVGEVAALRLSDLFLNEKTLRFVINGKGAKQRPGYFSPQTLYILRNYLSARPKSQDEHVFLTYQLKGLSTHGIQMRLDHFRKLAGVNFTCHQLRHSFATDLHNVDMPITSIQKLMGHQWIETTMQYVQANDKKVQSDFLAASQKLEGW
ncbi:MAG: site-specific tyrosine recombinase [Anaerolineales bacterium]